MNKKLVYFLNCLIEKRDYLFLQIILQFKNIPENKKEYPFLFNEEELNIIFSDKKTYL